MNVEMTLRKIQIVGAGFFFVLGLAGLINALLFTQSAGELFFSVLLLVSPVLIIDPKTKRGGP